MVGVTNVTVLEGSGMNGSSAPYCGGVRPSLFSSRQSKVGKASPDSPEFREKELPIRE